MLVNDTNISKKLFDHHACLLIGERNYWSPILVKEIKEFLKIENLNSSPDIWWSTHESFGIKDSHNLIGKEARKAFGGGGKFFVLEISSMTPEAQNALLKTFEEPVADTHFFLIVRTVEILLPTLLSRLAIFNQPGGDLEAKPPSHPHFGSASKFLKLDLPDRLDFIQKEFLKNKEVRKSETTNFVTNLEKTFRSQIDMKKISKDEEIALYELEKCQRYLQNPRSSNRLILEHLALVLP